MRISDWSSDVCSSDLRGQSSAASTMAAGFARKLSAAGLSQRYAASAATTLAQTVMPALDSQIAELAKLRPAASHDAGVWRLPDGERYYDATLRLHTTTDHPSSAIPNQ